MERNIEKLIHEYHDNYKCCFYADDVLQIYDTVQDVPVRDLAFTLVSNSLAVGYVIGHKAGIRAARKKKLLQLRDTPATSSELSPAEWHIVQMLRQSDPEYAEIIYELLSTPLGPGDEPELDVVNK